MCWQPGIRMSIIVYLIAFSLLLYTRDVSCTDSDVDIAGRDGDIIGIPDVSVGAGLWSGEEGSLHNNLASFAMLHIAAEKALVTGSDRLSPECELQKFFLKEGLAAKAMWALSMFDAVGKPRPGLLVGGLYWIGQYDQCLAIEFPIAAHQNSTPGYCYAMIILSFKMQSAREWYTFPRQIRWDFCLPPACDARDLVEIVGDVDVMVNEALPQFMISLNVTKSECLLPPPSGLAGDTRAIIATIILTVFGILVLGGTILDIKDSFLSPAESSSEAQVDASAHNSSSETARNEYSEIEGIEEPKLSVQETHENHDPDPHESVENRRAEEECLLKKSSSKRSNALPMVAGILFKVVRAFSLPTNLGKLLNTDKSPGTVTCLNGIRVLSMAYVILGHIYALAFGFPNFFNLSNQKDIFDELSHWPFQAIINADVSVDSFFFLSGLLVTYLFLQAMKKRNNKISKSMIGWYFFHRWWRLTPLYSFFLMCVLAYFKFMKSGPLWPKEFQQGDACYDIWWRNLLYINNLIDDGRHCISYTWYLANDMQFHVISPLILIPLARKPRVGFAIIGVLIAVHVFTTVGLIAHYGGGGPIPNRSTTGYSTYVYNKPYARVGVYCVGMIVGYMMVKYKRLTLNMWKVIMGWCFALTCIPLVTYLSWSEMQPGAEPWSVAARCVWEPLRRHLWALALGWIVLACHHGYGGCIDKLLSWSFWIPLSRLTYAAYLVHPIVVIAWSFSERELHYYSTSSMIVLYIPALVVSYGFAAIFSLVFESPFFAIEKLVIRGRHRLNKDVTTRSQSQEEHSDKN